MSIHHISTVSILGDSISTLRGYTPEEGIYYDTNYSRNTGVRSVEDTWWMKVILGLRGELLINNSYAGSTICRNGYQAASSPWRIRKLRKGEISPDYILIYSGLNDVAFYRTPEEFREHYVAMLDEMINVYPEAQIWCGTLCRGFLKDKNWPLFIDFNTCLPLAEYNKSIKEAVARANCNLADLSSFKKDYSSLDGVHPDAAGMDTLSQLWLRCMLE